MTLRGRSTSATASRCLTAGALEEKLKGLKGKAVVTAVSESRERRVVADRKACRLDFECLAMIAMAVRTEGVNVHFVKERKCKGKRTT